jgi:hypothetical protein
LAIGGGGAAGARAQSDDQLVSLRPIRAHRPEGGDRHDLAGLGTPAHEHQPLPIRRDCRVHVGPGGVEAREAYPDAFIAQLFASLEVFLAWLAYVAEARVGQPVIVIIDELPYLADVDRGFLTVLQHWWDQHKRLANLKLILTGSYVAFMGRQVLDAHAPLYNRRTGSLKLDPFAYHEATMFFPRYSARERVEVYAVLGGMPSYLEQFESDRGMSSMARSFGPSPPGIAGRATSRAIGRQAAPDVSAQLQALLDLDLIRREVPITERRRPMSRNSLYFLADNYLAF